VCAAKIERFTDTREFGDLVGRQHLIQVHHDRVAALRSGAGLHGQAARVPFATRRQVFLVEVHPKHLADAIHHDAHIEDHAVIAILEDMGGFECITAVADGRHRMIACAEDTPDILLLDIHMPDMNGLNMSLDVALATMRDSNALRAPSLTPRQEEMLRGIASGQSNKEIARELAVSV
jgi:hypothetical protein